MNSTDLQGRTMAQRALDKGAEHPYDAPNGWRNTDDNEPAPDAADWAHSASRGILNDLTDRRSIKEGFEDLDAGIRAEIVESLAEIIREADRRRLAP